MPANRVMARIRTIEQTEGGRETAKLSGTLSRSRGTGIHRRDFLGAWRTVAWMAVPSVASALASAREFVGAGAIGPVRFCRAASPRWVSVARRVCGDRALMVEIDAATSGAVLLGSGATLVIDGKGWRLLP